MNAIGTTPSKSIINSGVFSESVFYFKTDGSKTLVTPEKGHVGSLMKLQPQAQVARQDWENTEDGVAFKPYH